MTAETPGQADLLDALARVEEHANDDWLDTAADIVERLARSGQPFTTDDVWERLASEDVTTHEPRALGAVIRNATRGGLIVKTGQYVDSRRPESHKRPIPVWVSAVAVAA